MQGSQYNYVVTCSSAWSCFSRAMSLVTANSLASLSTDNQTLSSATNSHNSVSNAIDQAHWVTWLKAFRWAKSKDER